MTCHQRCLRLPQTLADVSCACSLLYKTEAQQVKRNGALCAVHLPSHYVSVYVIQDALMQCNFKSKDFTKGVLNYTLEPK